MPANGDSIARLLVQFVKVGVTLDPTLALMVYDVYDFTRELVSFSSCHGVYMSM